jgi:C4-dicarboxylate transporter
LPIVTGAGVAVLAGSSTERTSSFAAVCTVLASPGLFAYELHGIKKCAHLIDAAKRRKSSWAYTDSSGTDRIEFAGFIDHLSPPA